MGDEDIKKRLENLENRLKTNFFEIEKRLVNLESSPGKGGNLSERIQDVEDLLLLLQLENMKIREKIGSTGIPEIHAVEDKSGLEERVNELEEKLSNMKSGEVPTDIEDRLSALEEKSTTDMSEKIKELEEKINP